MDTSRRLLAVGLAALVLLSAAGSATAAMAQHDDQTDHDNAVDAPAVVVDLREDGSATVTVSFTYNLSDEDRKQAFEELRDSEDVRSDFRDRFESRMAGVANASEDATGQEMAVSNASLSFRTGGSTGVVEASVTWTGLAAATDDRVTLTEPFASGFESGRPVHVFAPEGYSVSAVTPGADGQNEGHLTWTAGTDLSGFELVVTAPDDEGSETDDSEEDRTTAGDSDDSSGAGDSGPGFGVLAAIGAVLVVAVLARWRD